MKQQPNEDFVSNQTLSTITRESSTSPGPLSPESKSTKQSTSLIDLVMFLTCLFSNTIKSSFSFILFRPFISLPIIAIIIILLTPTALKYLIDHFSTAKLLQLLTIPMPIIQNPITFIYCAVLKGPIFCKEKSVEVSKITRSVTDSAKLASDIFESVVGLGNPYNLNLHQANILELAIAVRYSTSLEGKEVLASQLTDLSEMSRDIKDQIISINSRGINTFSFIAYEFSRLQDLIELIQKGSREYTTQQVSHNLGILFERLSGDLARLLNDIELSIPLTSQAADLGTVITGQLLESYSKLLKIKEDTPLWKKFLEQGSWSQKQLARDLSLTSESVQSLKTVWKKLEELRSILLAYRNNVAFFKASVIGLHIADHQLSAEDEVRSMRHIINEFKQAVRDSKVPKKDLNKKLEIEG